MGNVAAAARALDGLDWFGRDSARERKKLAGVLLQKGDLEQATIQLQRSLALEPDVRGYTELAALEKRRGDLHAALAAYQAGLILEPSRLGLLHNSGETLLALNRPAEAEAFLLRAVSVAPDHLPSRAALQRARRMIDEASHLASKAADPL
jgi:Tfp pilus assembly protein PilF